MFNKHKLNFIYTQDGQFNSSTEVQINVDSKLTFTKPLYQVRIYSDFYVCLDGPVKLTTDLDNITFKITSGVYRLFIINQFNWNLIFTDNAENYILNSYKSLVWLTVAKAPNKQYDVITIEAFDKRNNSVAETYLLATSETIYDDSQNVSVVKCGNPPEYNQIYEKFFIITICVGVIILGLQIYDILHRRDIFQYNMISTNL